MATNYSTLGMTLFAPKTYTTTSGSATAPSPTSYPDYPIGTGRAAGTSAVGTTTDRGDDGYRGDVTVSEIAPISYRPEAPVKEYTSGIKGWIEEAVDWALAPDVEWNPVTGTYRATSPGGAMGVFTSLAPFGALAGYAGQYNVANLTNIASQAYEGAEGYAVGMVNGQVVGVSPGLFGRPTLSGTTGDLTWEQERSVMDQLLALENKAGAYRPEYDPSRTTPGAFSTTMAPSASIPAMSYAAAGYGQESGFESGAGYTPFSGYASETASADYSRGYYGEDMNVDTGSGGEDAGPSDTGGGYSDDTMGYEGGFDLASGGRIDMQSGGTAITSGFVNKDPSTVSDSMSIADNRYTSVPSGSFVVNQPANEQYKGVLDAAEADASKRVKLKKGGKTEMVDVALSDGERLIKPEVVAAIEKKHGKNFLDKINNTGKAEVKRRQAKYGEKVGAAEGGSFLSQGMEIKDVGEDVPYDEYLPVSNELVAKLAKFGKGRKPQRKQIKEFIRSLSPEDKLTVLYLTETQSTTDPLESMEAIGEVVKNRMESDYYDFKNLNTFDDVLLKQTKKGAFHFSGLEPSTFYARAKEVAKGTADVGLRKSAAAAQNTLDPEREGQNILPFGTVFYTRKDAPSQWMRESKDLEYATELGEHEFYRTFVTKEYP